MGRGKSIKSKMQESILKGRGLEVTTSGLVKKVHKELSDSPSTTLAMRLLEEQYGTSIESLIRYGTIKEVAEFLGIKESTVSKWRLRLGLRTMVNQGG